LPYITRPSFLPSMLKQWSDEIKMQESAICKIRWNASNLASQTGENITAQNTELHPFQAVASDINRTSSAFKTEAPHSVTNESKFKNISPEILLKNVCTKFTLNQKQRWAFTIIANNFLHRCIYNVEGTKPLRMLMTGPGGTGKPHVIKAVKEVMSHYGSAHKICFLAPTGSASSLIDGMTIHKGLSIKIVNNDCHGNSGRILGKSKDDHSVLVSIRNKTAIRDEW
jgi:hypothetical protein